MNKKFKAFVALTIALQLLLPAAFLFYSRTMIDTTLEKGAEFKFRLNYIYMEEAVSSDSEKSYFLNIYIPIMSYREKIRVCTDPDGFAVTYLASGENDWFYRSFAHKSQRLSGDQLIFEDALSDSVLSELLFDSVKNSDEEISQRCYLTARVYKGFFIPTAIYLDNERIITINI